MRPTTIIALLAVLAAAPVAAVHAGDTGRKVGGVVEESAKTGGRAVRDGALTFGRTTRDFFTQGPSAAQRTWRANEAQTKANAREGADRVRDEAHQ
ncbi:MAG: hypothetical protein KIT14_02910 [bacterium]|nr:hypothetical protein [Phycisphaeraceae bacterium]MCW5889481.1 hypothetical protein [bacterium]